MAPSKFEKHIKKQFEEREIQPSLDAWAKVSDRLAHPSESNKRGYSWYGIAAGFIGILFVSLFYFNSKKPTMEPEVQIITTPEVSVQESVIETDLGIEVENNELPIRSGIRIGNKIGIVAPKNPETVKTVHSAVVEKEKIISKTTKVPSNLPEQIIDVKIAEVMIQVVELEKKDTEITDIEIDSLLRQAQREILADKMFGKDKSVDPTMLLADVERELDRSFRDEIFDALKDGFVKVRIAVADRNK